MNALKTIGCGSDLIVSENIRDVPWKVKSYRLLLESEHGLYDEIRHIFRNG